MPIIFKYSLKTLGTKLLIKGLAIIQAVSIKSIDSYMMAINSLIHSKILNINVLVCISHLATIRERNCSRIIAINFQRLENRIHDSES